MVRKKIVGKLHKNKNLLYQLFHECQSLELSLTLEGIESNSNERLQSIAVQNTASMFKELAKRSLPSFPNSIAAENLSDQAVPLRCENSKLDFAFPTVKDFLGRIQSSL
jgi:hypothetical protein